MRVFSSNSAMVPLFCSLSFAHISQRMESASHPHLLTIVRSASSGISGDSFSEIVSISPTDFDDFCSSLNHRTCSIRIYGYF